MDSRLFSSDQESLRLPVVTVVHLAVVAFIVIAGLSQAKASNFSEGGWAPFGVRGVWNGAALVFFSYIGFDAVATTAEEVCVYPIPKPQPLPRRYACTQNLKLNTATTAEKAFTASYSALA